MIEKVISKSRTTEVDALILLIIAAYESSNISGDARLIAILIKLRNYSIKLNLAINHIKEQSILKSKGKERDTSIRCFYYTIYSCTLRTNETISSAAKIIMAIFDHYGLDMIKTNYGIETSLIKSLLVDLSTTEAQNNLAIIPNASDVILEIQETQSSFEEYNLSYEKAKAQESQNENATTLKAQAIDIINNQLVSYLRVVIEIEDNDFEGFAEIVKQLISDNNIKVKNRSNNPEEESSDEGDESDITT